MHTLPLLNPVIYLPKRVVLMLVGAVFALFAANTAAQIKADVAATTTQAPVVTMVRALALVTTTRQTIESVQATPLADWQTFNPSTTYPLNADAALWVQMQLSVSPSTTTAKDWRIQLPKPFIDRFELHPIGSDSGLPVQTAGDNIPNQAWPVPGLYPQVLLPSMASGQHTALLRIVNNVPANFQLQLLSQSQAQAEKTDVLVNISAVTVLLMCMMVVSACLGLVFRDSAYAWYSVYALLTSLFVVGYTGLASYLLWPAASNWPPSAVHITAALSVLVQMVFCYRCFDAFKLRPGLQLAVRAAVFITLIATACLYIAIGSISLFLVLFLGPMIANAVLIVWIVLPRLRQGDTTAKLWLVAYLPLMILVALTAFDNLGFFAHSVVGYHWVIYSLAFEMPLLLLALLLRAKSRHAQAVIQHTRGQLDPLTGFVLPRAYQAVAEPMWQQSAAAGEHLAVVYIQITQPGVPYLAGSSHAPRSESIVRVLRTVFRQEDSYAQINSDLYAILVPGKMQTELLQNRLTRLVAQLRVLSQELKTDYPLRARIAACTNRSLPQSWSDVHTALLGKFNDETHWGKRSIHIVSKRHSQRSDEPDLSDFWAHAYRAEASTDGLAR